MCKLSEIQHRLKAPKGQYNSFGKYKYRSCEDILEAVKPVLHEVGCFLTLSDSLELVGDRYYVKATARLQGPDTDVTCTAYAREDLDKKGMDGSQITGTASSYARKYALNGLFCIDDTKDADTDEYTKQNGKNANQAPLSAPKSDKPIMHRGHENWENILKSILDGKATLEQYKKKYFFPEADEIAAKEWLLTHQ
jgi:hypothetical protein